MILLFHLEDSPAVSDTWTPLECCASHEIPSPGPIAQALREPSRAHARFVHLNGTPPAMLCFVHRRSAGAEWCVSSNVMCYKLEDPRINGLSGVQLNIPRCLESEEPDQRDALVIGCCPSRAAFCKIKTWSVGLWGDYQSSCMALSYRWGQESTWTPLTIVGM